MNFEIVTQAISIITKTIENSSVAIVLALKKHTFLVNVINPVKKVDVVGIRAFASDNFHVVASSLDIKAAA
jgi:hypothetical protein